MNFSRLIWVLAVALAPLLLIVLIAINGVNVPFWDEWGIQTPFLIMEKRTLADFFAQSNESRMVVPKLIFLAVSKVAGWQPKHYMYFGWFLVLIIFVLIYKLCYSRLYRRHKHDLIILAAVFLSGALLFSPTAIDNWTWGIQWAIFVPLLCALAGLFIQYRTRSFILRLGATVALNLVAMFTFSNGMLLWLVSFPFWYEGIRFLAGRRSSGAGIARLAAWSLAYVLMALVSVRIYFSDYQHMPAHPPLSYVFHEPWNVLKYLAAWCAGPFRSNIVIRIVIGMLLIFSVLVLIAWIARRVTKDRGWRSVAYLRTLYPSLLIIAYAFGSGLMTALGRAGFGVEQAFDSRYLFHSGTLSVGLVAALNAHRMFAMRTRKEVRNHSLALAGVVALFLVFVILGWREGIGSFSISRLARTQSLLTVRMLTIAPKSPLVDRLCPWADVSVLAKALKDRNIYSPPSFGDWMSYGLKHPHPETGGAVQIKRVGEAGTILIGWAAIPHKNTPADLVLVCRKGESGNLEPWMMLVVGFTRKEVVKSTGQRSLLKCGFQEAFPWKSADPIPPMELFAVDEKSKLLYPIPFVP
jgi:hypothetical protein